MFIKGEWVFPNLSLDFSNIRFDFPNLSLDFTSELKSRQIQIEMKTNSKPFPIARRRRLIKGFVAEQLAFSFMAS